MALPSRVRGALHFLSTLSLPTRTTPGKNNVQKNKKSKKNIKKEKPKLVCPDLRHRSVHSVSREGSQAASVGLFHVINILLQSKQESFLKIRVLQSVTE